jgi:hypothetical protein
MNHTLDRSERFERNLLWQVRNDPAYCDHPQRIASMIAEGGVLRRCVECGCAILHDENTNRTADRIAARCITCGRPGAE